MRIALVLALVSLPVAAQAQQTLTLEIRDYATLPITGQPIGKTSNEMLLARVNAIREEPGGAPRLFVTDMNGPLYILDKKTKQLTKYLDFDGRDDRPGMFHRFFITSGYGNGLNGFHFDPDYRRTGKFYTVHMEDPNLTVSNLPDAKNQPGLKVDGYTTTPTINTPGNTVNEGVLIEWTDTNTANTSFEGTARELMRVRLNTRSHPMGELTFNPFARAGDPDWRVLYGEVGDGASGESRVVAIRNNPQRLDNLVGKIIRIIPDLNEHTGDELRQRKWPVSHSERQPVREDEGRTSRDLGLRPSEPAPAELGTRSGEPARGKADCQFGWIPHLGDRQRHRARHQSWLAVQGRQPGAVSRSAIACDRCPSWTRFRRRSATKSPTRSSRRNTR